MATIKFKYIFDDDFNPKYVNGAFGGSNPKGEISINFFLERPAVPVSQTHEVSSTGMIDLNPISQEPSDLSNSLVRFVQSGVILNLDTAKAISVWLQVQIAELEKNATGRAVP